MTRRVSVGPGGAQANGQQLRSGDLRGRPVRGVLPRTRRTWWPGTPTTRSDVFVRDRGTQVTRRVSVGRGRRPGQRPQLTPRRSPRTAGTWRSPRTRRTWWPGTPTTPATCSCGTAGRPRDPAGVGRSGRRPGQRRQLRGRRSPRTAGTWRSSRTRRTWWPATPTTPPTCSCGTARAHVTRRVSVGRGRRPGQRRRAPARRSPRDGRYVAFDSDASNLVAGDTNDTADVFVRDRAAT